MIAANFDSLLFFLLVAVAVLFQLLAKAAGKTGKDQTKRTSTPPTPPPIPRAPRQSDEEQIRKLLEALGQPPTSRPPPPVVPRIDIPPRPLAPVQPPISLPRPPLFLPQEERRKREMTPKKGAPSPTVTRAEKIVSPKIMGTPTFEVHEGPLPVESPSVTKAPSEAYAATRTIAGAEKARIDIATLLASTSGLRAGMILREILGPPRGLRTIDLV